MVEILKEAKHDSGHSARPLVIAYFTVDTPYEHEAETLKASLESVGYSYHVCGIPNFGSWQRNTQAKAYFVQQMLQTYPGRPLLYLDVDAIMVKAPELLDNLDADIAAAHFAKKPRGRPMGELLSGTVYFGNTVQCNRVVQKWININEQYPETLPNGRAAWDQRTLEIAIKRISSVKFVELPTEYTFIVELTQRHHPNLQPVILHTRGAKRFKRLVNGQKGYEK